MNTKTKIWGVVGWLLVILVLTLLISTADWSNGLKEIALNIGTWIVLGIMFIVLLILSIIDRVK